MTKTQQPEPEPIPGGSDTTPTYSVELLVEGPADAADAGPGDHESGVTPEAEPA